MSELFDALDEAQGTRYEPVPLDAPREYWRHPNVSVSGTITIVSPSLLPGSSDIERVYRVVDHPDNKFAKGDIRIALKSHKQKKFRNLWYVVTPKGWSVSERDRRMTDRVEDWGVVTKLWGSSEGDKVRKAIRMKQDGKSLKRSKHESKEYVMKELIERLEEAAKGVLSKDSAFNVVENGLLSMLDNAGLKRGKDYVKTDRGGDISLQMKTLNGMIQIALSDNDSGKDLGIIRVAPAWFDERLKTKKFPRTKPGIKKALALVKSEIERRKS